MKEISLEIKAYVSSYIYLQIFETCSSTNMQPPNMILYINILTDYEID